MTGLSLVQDAATPAASSVQPGVIVSAGYIGGDAAHVWTSADWAVWGTRYRVPIWVRSNPSTVDPTTDANACVAALTALGAPAPYLVLPYGSTSTLFQNPQCDGYWPAVPGPAQLYSAPGIVATQYALDVDDAYDLSVLDQSIPTWDTQAGTGPTAIMLDLEEAADPAWVTTFAAVVKAAGLNTGEVTTTINGSFKSAPATSPDGQVWTISQPFA
jgi:hypothetical protein